MKVRLALSTIAVATTLWSTALPAQAQATPIGTWRSTAQMLRDWPVSVVIELTVASVAADQRASGRFQIYGLGGGFPNFCLNGPVAGSFDGSALKVVSPVSNLCAERVWDLKLAGDALIGTYRGADGSVADMTFNRQR